MRSETGDRGGDLQTMVKNLSFIVRAVGKDFIRRVIFLFRRLTLDQVVDRMGGLENSPSNLGR